MRERLKLLVTIASTVGTVLGVATWGKNIREWGELLDGLGLGPGGVLLLVGASGLSWVIWGELRTLSGRIAKRSDEIVEDRKRLSDLEGRVSRSEWDWADLKRLHPELVEDFPPKIGGRCG